jgi:hypothetical protein
MNSSQRAAVLAALADKLQQAGSWCGETHIQKSTYALQELLGVPTEFRFILYKHGPFSFDLRDELTAMRADNLLTLQVKPQPYGPSLVPTEDSRRLRERFSNTVSRYASRIAFAAEKFGNRGVTDLERLATALYVTREGVAGHTGGERARRLHELKPHVSLADAEAAVAEVDRVTREAGPLLRE